MAVEAAVAYAKEVGEAAARVVAPTPPPTVEERNEEDLATVAEGLRLLIGLVHHDEWSVRQCALDAMESLDHALLSEHAVVLGQLAEASDDWEVRRRIQQLLDQTAAAAYFATLVRGSQYPGGGGLVVGATAR